MRLNFTYTENDYKNELKYNEVIMKSTKVKMIIYLYLFSFLVFIIGSIVVYGRSFFDIRFILNSIKYLIYPTLYLLVIKIFKSSKKSEYVYVEEHIELEFNESYIVYKFNDYENKIKYKKISNIISMNDYLIVDSDIHDLFIPRRAFKNSNEHNDLLKFLSSKIKKKVKKKIIYNNSYLYEI